MTVDEIEVLKQELESARRSLGEAESELEFYKTYAGSQTTTPDFPTADALRADWERLKARVEELERERDEALLLVEGPGTLRELANEYGRAMMREAELLARERRVRQALKNIDGIMPRDSTAQLILGIIRDTLAAVGVDGATTRQTD